MKKYKKKWLARECPMFVFHTIFYLQKQLLFTV